MLKCYALQNLNVYYSVLIYVRRGAQTQYARHCRSESLDSVLKYVSDVVHKTLQVNVSYIAS